MMKSRRNESFRLKSPTEPSPGSSSRRSLGLRGSLTRMGSSPRLSDNNSSRSLSRSGSSGLIDQISESNTEEAFLYHHIKRMSIEDKEDLLNRIMQGHTPGKSPSSSSHSRRSSKKKDLSNYLWSPKSVKSSDKRESMSKVMSSGNLGLKNIKMPF